MAGSLWKKEIHVGRRRHRGTVVVPIMPSVHRLSQGPLGVSLPPEPVAAQEVSDTWVSDTFGVAEPFAEADTFEPDTVEPVAAPEPEPAETDQHEWAEVEEAVFEDVPETVAADAPADTAPKKSLLRHELHLPRPRLQRSRDSDHPVTRVVGLRIGSSQLAAAHVRNNGTAELVQLARRPLPRGVVVGGEVREPEALVSELKAFFGANKLPQKDIRLGVASNRIGVRTIEVPAIDDPKQFQNAMLFRAQEVLPIAVSDAILDHVVLSEETNEQGEAVRQVLLVFAHRELVDRYVDVCRRAGLRLAGIDLDAFALLRAINQPRSVDAEPGNAVVAVSVGRERTVFAVSDGRVCDFTRVLEWGGAALDAALARALDLAPSEAEPIKHSLSLSSSEPTSGLTPIQLEAARSVVEGEIAVLGRELLSSLRFYQARPGSLDIGEVLVSGGVTHLEGFAESLQRALGVPVRVADPLGRVTLARKLSIPAETGSIAIAVGLGIED